MSDNFEVDADTYEGIDIEQVKKNNLEYAGTTLQNQWRENMRRAGYVNDGEAVNSITIAMGKDEVLVGSDKVQVAVGEYGRRPGSAMPPYEPIADWVHEQSGMPSKGQMVTIDTDDGKEEITFRSFVFLVRRGIAENGLPEWGFGRDAFKRSTEDIENDLEERINRQLELAQE